MTDVDPVREVQRMWPQDGPHTADSLGTGAAAIRELFRTLANATTAGGALDALPVVSDAYDLLGALATAATSQQHLLEDLAGWAAQFGDDPTLRHFDHRDDPGGGVDHAQTSMREAAEALREAAGHTEALIQALHRAWSLTSPLSHHDPDEDR